MKKIIKSFILVSILTTTAYAKNCVISDYELDDDLDPAVHNIAVDIEDALIAKGYQFNEKAADGIGIKIGTNLVDGFATYTSTSETQRSNSNIGVAIWQGLKELGHFITRRKLMKDGAVYILTKEESYKESLKRINIGDDQVEPILELINDYPDCK